MTKEFEQWYINEYVKKTSNEWRSETSLPSGVSTKDESQYSTFASSRSASTLSHATSAPLLQSLSSANSGQRTFMNSTPSLQSTSVGNSTTEVSGSSVEDDIQAFYKARKEIMTKVSSSS